jgi:hypothetical protein
MVPASLRREGLRRRIDTPRCAHACALRDGNDAVVEQATVEQKGRQLKRGILSVAIARHGYFLGRPNVAVETTRQEWKECHHSTIIVRVIAETVIAI